MKLRAKVARYTGCTLFFLLCLAFFLVRGFPAALIQERLVVAARQALGAQLKIDRFGTLFPNGVEAEDVRLNFPARDKQESYQLKADKIRARVSLLGLLFGRRTFTFELDLLAGRAEGSLTFAGEQGKLNTELSGMDLGRIPFWMELLGQQLSGKLAAGVEFQFSPRDLKQLQGTLSLRIEQGKIGKGKLYGVELPLIDLGKTEVHLDIQKGKADVKAASIKSEDVDASLEGYFLLQPRLTDTTSHCRLRVKPTERLLNEMKSRLPPEFHGLLEGELNRARGADGHLRYSIFGRIFAGGASIQPLRQ